MEHFICKAEIDIKVIGKFTFILIFFLINWLRKYLIDSDDSASNEEFDEYEVEDTEKDMPSLTNRPIARNVFDTQPQALSCDKVVAKNLTPSQPASLIVKDCKTSFRSKRKLFRRALVMHAIMESNDFIR